MLIRYFLTDMTECEARTRDVVPIPGDIIQFDSGSYTVVGRVWLEDDFRESEIHILIEKKG